MEIICGKTSGFCFGIKRTVDIAKEMLDKYNTIHCLGKITHNEYLTGELKKKGLIQIEDIAEISKDNRLIIRPHGAAPQIYDEAKEKNLELIDLTCPKVKSVHTIAEKYKNNGYTIIITGEKDHVEVIGTKGWAGDNCYVVSSVDELENITVSDKACLISQTTFSVERFSEIAEYLKRHYKNIEIVNTICKATFDRQTETKEIASSVDLMIIIGGKNSSNTNKLFDISKKECQNAIFLQDDENMDLEYIRSFKKIGIMAGASTPNELVEKIIDKIKKIG